LHFTFYSTDIFLISSCFPLLEVLNLSYPFDYENDEKIEHLSSTFFNLRKIDLSGLHDLDDELLSRLFKNCKLLEQVIILDCLILSIVSVVSALGDTLRLTSLSFSTCWGRASEYEEDYQYYITSQFNASLVSLKYLTYLDLFSSNISDEVLYSIANEGLPLTRLVLQDCIGYSYSGIFYFLSKCQHCQHLDLQNADFLTDKHVAELC
jgi:hypothetical protein